MYDAIIVGARCAGAATGMLLARKGYKVLLVDKSAFPSDVPQGHFVHRHGPPRLARWGVRLAQFKPIPAEMLRIRAAVRGNPDLSRQYVLARQGLVPWESLMASLAGAA